MQDDRDVSAASTDTDEGDAVRLSKKRFRATYEQGFRVWAKLYDAAVKEPSFPLGQLRDVLCERLPSFPPGLHLSHNTMARESCLCADGSSTWAGSSSRCMPTFQLPVQMQVTAKAAHTLVTESPAADSGHRGWFHNGGPDDVAVLALAWSYILSARWTEVMPGSCVLTYSESAAAHRVDSRQSTSTEDDSIVVVDIGVEASVDEARWWAAVLADDQGWHATARIDGEAFVAPWSVRRQQGHHRFVVLSRNHPPTDSCHESRPAPAPPSSSDASRFLQRFCARHAIAEQSHAALAAVLLFPLVGSRPLRLPVSPANNTTAARPVEALSPAPSPDWKDDDLDRLMTLSCYTQGLRPMLLSVFYEPSIDCNAASAWLQGSLAAIDTLAAHEDNASPTVVRCGTLMRRSSSLAAFLWLGATVLGLQGTLLTEAGWGQMPINLHAAAWSGTVQTFLQLPTLCPASGTQVSRADECRLLFLSRSDNHRRLPLVQWKPFGTTPLDDVDLGVRRHTECKQESHQLTYRGFEWVVTGRPEQKTSENTVVWTSQARDDRGSDAVVDTSDEASETPISYAAMNRAREGVTENATRNIFSWLRIDGWPQHEKEIYSHEWFDVFDSDEEAAEASGSVDKNEPLGIQLWLSRVDT